MFTVATRGQLGWFLHTLVPCYRRCKKTRVPPEIALRDARRIIFVLLLCPLWAAVPRPSVALRELPNASMCLWEDETKGGWRHRLRAPPDRLLVSLPPPPLPLLPPSLPPCAHSVEDESSPVSSSLVCEGLWCLKLVVSAMAVA